jgi:hypothetical protein
VLQVNGISVHVEDHGSGKPVLLLHARPDSAYLWRNQNADQIADPSSSITASRQSRRTCVASVMSPAPSVRKAGHWVLLEITMLIFQSLPARI